MSMVERKRRSRAKDARTLAHCRGVRRRGMRAHPSASRLAAIAVQSTARLARRTVIEVTTSAELIRELLHVEIVAPCANLAVGRDLERAHHRQRDLLAVDLEAVDAL